MLRVGQKVFRKGLCDSCNALIKQFQPSPMPRLEDGVIYTIRELRSTGFNAGFCPSALLQEITSPVMHSPILGMAEPGYISCSLRPVSESYLENFKKLITPSPEVLAEKKVKVRK